ncbi:chymotrypsin-like elastase family member 2A [Oppia nitens]|uniref:chymotrypsin-like elastase family member 2A n=1 Tax=Oppia nitens TaxID=1686743 RepID=UPI0023DAE3A7|nr:chymotrypsin-like elastase family member 2A [Oppia nitens]
MYVIHPNYTEFMKTIPGLQHAYDIALLKLTSNISMSTTTTTELTVGRYPTVNPICLPDRDSVNTDKELALFAGFGRIDVNVLNMGPLRTGWIRMNEPSDSVYDLWSHLIRNERYPINHGSGVCNGDSGGPLIQYGFDDSPQRGVSGRRQRAVLIGVALGYWPNTPGCPSKDTGAGNTFVRISKHIDWIINTVTANNTTK